MSSRTVRDLRRDNRATVLRAVYFDGPLSRQDLTGHTGLSAGTLSNVTAELLADGVLIEAGTVGSNGGRPRVLLRVNASHRYVIGVDIGETEVKVELFDLAMTDHATARYPLPDGPGDVDTVVSRIVAGIDQVVARAKVPADRLLGAGIGVPGTVTAQRLVHAPTIGWAGVPLTGLIHRATSLPLFIDNGAKTMGRAESWFGAGRQVDHTIMALIGTGVGAAVIVDGRTHHGASSSAGEWGHTTMALDGRPCRCGARGCLETYVGAEAIVDGYRQRGGDPSAGLAEILAAGTESDAAREAVAEAVSFLGAGLSDLVNLFNPRRIVLGGWAGLLLGAAVLPQIREATAGYALAQPFDDVEIVLGELGTDAVALGAATLVVEDFLDNSDDDGGGDNPA